MTLVQLRLKINTEVTGIIMEKQHLQLQIPDHPETREKSLSLALSQYGFVRGFLELLTK